MTANLIPTIEEPRQELSQVAELDINHTEPQVQRTNNDEPWASEALTLLLNEYLSVEASGDLFVYDIHSNKITL